jgi:hypothetical protein
MPDLSPNAPARAVVIPHDGRDAIYECLIPRPDGGLAALEEAVEGVADTMEWRGLPGVVIFYNEDRQTAQLSSDWNIRATHLLAKALPVGGCLYGHVILCGLQDDGGICDLPASVTADAVLLSAVAR